MEHLRSAAGRGNEAAAEELAQLTIPVPYYQLWVDFWELPKKSSSRANRSRRSRGPTRGVNPSGYTRVVGATKSARPAVGGTAVAGHG